MGSGWTKPSGSRPVSGLEQLTWRRSRLGSLETDPWVQDRAVVLLVVSSKELLTEGAAVLDAVEAIGERGNVLQGAKLSCSEYGLIIGNIRALRSYEPEPLITPLNSFPPAMAASRGRPGPPLSRGRSASRGRGPATTRDRRGSPGTRAHGTRKAASCRRAGIP